MDKVSSDGDLFDVSIPDRIYLPATNEYSKDTQDLGVSSDLELENYISREFPSPPPDTSTANYSIPRTFVCQGKQQASKAEETTYQRLCGVSCPQESKGTLWQVCFQGACYAGRSYRNERAGKIMMREHDFVVFNIYEGRYYVSLIEVKSTCDDPSTGFIVSNPTSIKNNKRSGLHQLRDHVEILEKSYGIPKETLHCYLFWPYLTMWTKDPTGKKIQRWKEEEEKHVFTDTLVKQEIFNEWFLKRILKGKSIEQNLFDTLFKRFIIMSCGIFVNEIHNGIIALMSQEQLSLLYRKPAVDGSPVIVHGAAGTGKTLLVLHKIKQLFDCGLLNEKNRALYICYWPGIRFEVQNKLEKMNLSKYVDTIRFFISQEGFLSVSKKKYRHIFMDECEAICLAFGETIITQTFENIVRCRLTEADEQYENNHILYSSEINYISEGCGYIIENNEIVKKRTPRNMHIFGEMWFLVDINQAALFLPKHSPPMLKNPQAVLTKVIRNTAAVYNVFSHFYKNPIPAAAQLADMYLNTIDIGHKIQGPPVYWVNSDIQSSDENENNCVQSKTFISMIKVIIDLCSTKGIKPNDLCVIPFIVIGDYLPEKINEILSSYYVTDGYRPVATANVEDFISDCDPNIFLVPWVLRVKGLEFKVVVIAIEQGDFDAMDPEDRRKIYIMASRCTCLLVLISSESVKQSIDPCGVIQSYGFGIEL